MLGGAARRRAFFHLDLGVQFGPFGHPQARGLDLTLDHTGGRQLNDLASVDVAAKGAMNNERGELEL